MEKTVEKTVEMTVEMKILELIRINQREMAQITGLIR